MHPDIHKIAPTFFGLSVVPKPSWKEYGYILLNIAGSDGQVSDEELEWLTIDCAQAVGVTPDIIAKWEDYDYEDDDLEELFFGLNAASFANFNKLLIYDAIRMCSADGDYAEDERDQVYHAAQIMKVPPEAVTAIEALVDLERAANKLRVTIL